MSLGSKLRMPGVQQEGKSTVSAVWVNYPLCVESSESTGLPISILHEMQPHLFSVLQLNLSNVTACKCRPNIIFQGKLH